MIDVLKHFYDGQRDYVIGLVDGVDDERRVAQPSAGMNHPAWIVGHLAWASDGLARLLTGEVGPRGEDWTRRYGMRSKCVADPGEYEPLAALLDAFRDSHERVTAALPLATPEAMAREMPDPRMRRLLPTVGHAVAGLMTRHEGFHLGQLSAWRRAMGMPPYAALMFA